MGKVLLLGSSHIRKFEKFVIKKQSDNPFCLDYPRIDIYFHGISGGRIYNISHTDTFSSAIGTCHPDKIIFQIGGNDLDSTNLSEEHTKEVVDKVIAISRTFVRSLGVQHVVICQFLPRFKTRNCSVDKYNSRVIEANKHMKQTLIADCNIHYWKLKGLKDIDNFEDGVHLTDQAQHKYYRSIRGAIIHDF